MRTGQISPFSQRRDSSEAQAPEARNGVIRLDLVNLLHDLRLSRKVSMRKRREEAREGKVGIATRNIF